jgi:hypothetical protein
MAGRDRIERDREVAGKKIMRTVNEGGRERMKAVTDVRARYACRSDEAASRIENSVNREAACHKNDIMNWDMFLDLVPNLKFLEDADGPGVPLAEQDKVMWEAGHKEAIAPGNPKRRAALALLAEVKSGNYTPWDGIDDWAKNAA